MFNETTATVTVYYFIYCKEYASTLEKADGYVGLTETEN